MNNKNVIVDAKTLDNLSEELSYMLIEINTKLEPASRRLEKVSEVAPLMLEIKNNLEQISDEIAEKIDAKSVASIQDALKKVEHEISSLSSMISVSVQDVTIKYETTLLRILDHHIDVSKTLDYKINSIINETLTYINVKKLEKDIKEQIIDSLKRTSRNELRHLDGFKNLSLKLKRQQDLYSEHVEKMIKVNEKFENNLQAYKTSFKYVGLSYILAGGFIGVTLSYYFLS